MLGAIAGDIAGSPYEWGKTPGPGFPLFPPSAVFTDDTVCTVAVAEALLGGGDFAASLRRWVRRFPDAGYGARFKDWAMADAARPSDSWGNGAAMRAAPVGWMARDEADALALARKSAVVSHNHPEAIAGAQAVALAVLLARTGRTAGEIRAAIEKRFGYSLVTDPARLPPFRGMDLTARGTVPPALSCALAARDWEGAVRSAIALGGDTDTLAAMAGAVAEALHGLPRPIATQALSRLAPDLLAATRRFAAVAGRRRP
ncbi:MAG: ADP-ribosylglycohydrolase family protein [Alphaproteobacteria bacterium]|nr:ADP-ribosylglycohydrolase family protein [Alphaproteobacteria bacterium]